MDELLDKGQKPLRFILTYLPIIVVVIGIAISYLLENTDQSASDTCYFITVYIAFPISLVIAIVHKFILKKKFF